MTLIQGFMHTDPFYDDAHFPHGFRKSGDFTIVEDELLTNLGNRLFLLEQDLCTPANQTEEQFVQMCRSQLDGQTRVELLWQKYKKLTKHRTFHSLTGNV